MKWGKWWRWIWTRLTRDSSRWLITSCMNAFGLMRNYLKNTLKWLHITDETLRQSNQTLKCGVWNSSHSFPSGKLLKKQCKDVSLQSLGIGKDRHPTQETNKSQNFSAHCQTGPMSHGLIHSSIVMSRTIHLTSRDGIQRNCILITFEIQSWKRP